METLILKRDATRLWLLALSLGLGAGMAGCSSQRPAAAQSQRQATSVDDAIPDVLATIGDEQITMADIRTRAGDQLAQLETRFERSRHRLVESTLQDILRDRVLLAEAKKQNKTLDQFLSAEIGGPLEPTDADISAWYQANASRTGGRKLDQIRSQIAGEIRRERRDQAAKKLEDRLYQERKVSVALEPYRLQFNNEGAPTMGPADAPVTLVEFSDFQCPFCHRFAPTLKQLEQNFGAKLRIVYRQYPIPGLHPNAFKAAEASLCAHEQDKFWDIHDLMFQEQDQLAVKDLKVLANRLGLDQKKFDTCLDSGRYTEQVQADMAEGARVGVTGTPALFVNGIPVDGGAVSYDLIAKVIDRELERGKR